MKVRGPAGDDEDYNRDHDDGDGGATGVWSTALQRMRSLWALAMMGWRCDGGGGGKHQDHEHDHHQQQKLIFDEVGMPYSSAAKQRELRMGVY